MVIDMKKTKLTLIIPALAMLLVLAAISFGHALATDDPINVVVNGKAVFFPDVQPFIDINRRTFVPVRFVCEELGCDVEWRPESGTVALYRGLIKVELTIEQREITVLGVKKMIDTAAHIQDGRTLVPVRFVAEAFGCEVVWNASTQTVTITNPDKDIYKIGDFIVEIEEGDKLSINTAGGLVVVKETGLILGEGKCDGKPVLRVTIIVDDPVGDVPKQRVEAEALLKQQIRFDAVDGVIAHAAKLTTFSDDLEIKSWFDDRYDVSAGGGRGVISIMVYMNQKEG